MATAVLGRVESISSLTASSRGPTGCNGTVAADISVAVIHDRARRSCTARRREVVNNCAAGENFAGERPAPARSQSQSPNPQRVIGRPLAEPEALAPTSHRKRQKEASRRRLYQRDGRQGKATHKPPLSLRPGRDLLPAASPKEPESRQCLAPARSPLAQNHLQNEDRSNPLQR